MMPDTKTTVEDFRVRMARQALADARAALDDETRPYDPAGAAGRLQVAVEHLLQVVAEQAAVIDERAARERTREQAMTGEPIECVFCGEEYDPANSDADRPRDYCCADHQRSAFGQVSP